MKKEILPIEPPLYTLVRRGNKSQLHYLIEKIEELEPDETCTFYLWMGYSFFHRVKPYVDRQDKDREYLPIHPMFAGCRFLLDESVPPNMCILRDARGVDIRKFFWSE